MALLPVKRCHDGSPQFIGRLNNFGRCEHDHSGVRCCQIWEAVLVIDVAGAGTGPRVVFHFHNPVRLMLSDLVQFDDRVPTVFIPALLRIEAETLSAFASLPLSHLVSVTIRQPERQQRHCAGYECSSRGAYRDHPIHGYQPTGSLDCPDARYRIHSIASNHSTLRARRMLVLPTPRSVAIWL